MSQAIETKYLGATNTKPRRIKATHSGGALTVTVNSDYSLDAAPDHQRAAQKLRDKLHRESKGGWGGTLVGGETKEGMAWVFVNGSPTVSEGGARTWPRTRGVYAWDEVVDALRVIEPDFDQLPPKVAAIARKSLADIEQAVKFYAARPRAAESELD